MLPFFVQDIYLTLKESTLDPFIWAGSQTYVLFDNILPIIYIGRKNDFGEIWIISQNILNHQEAMPG